MTERDAAPPAQRTTDEDVSGHVLPAEDVSVPDQARRHPDAYDLYAQIYALRARPSA